LITTAAAEATVLLKSHGSVLPLKQNSKILVIGQHAAVPTVGGGGSAKVDSARSISPLTELKEAGVVFDYEPGVPVFGAVPLPDPESITSTSTNGPEIPGKPVRLEWFNGSSIGANLCHEQFLDKTEYMIKERWPSYLNAEYCTRLTFNYTPETSGNHLLSVLTTGKATLYIDDKQAFHRPQEQHLQREAFYFYRSKFERRFHFEMESNKTYSIRLESWATEPDALARTIGGAVIQGSGVRFFESVDVPTQIQHAADAAYKVDIALVFTGTTNEFESEGYDRETMDLTADQYKLISAVSAQNRKTVIVNYSGSPVNMVPFVDDVTAILQCWFPGQEAGRSIARVLTGQTNPCGCLPMSWPRNIEDNASFGNWPTGDNDVIRYEEGIFGGYKGYDLPDAKAPLFPFGFGLSYSSFNISNILIEGKIGSADEFVTVSCSVENTGKKDGKKVVQFYVQAPADGVVKRAVKELKAFQKPLVKAQSSQTVSVKLDKYAVSFYDVQSDCWRATVGTYQLLVGFSAAEFVGSATFGVSEGFTWKGL
jgi:beta-glucosidase